jgi:uncharacterized protein YgbK (DUF1537 family)
MIYSAVEGASDEPGTRWMIGVVADDLTGAAEVGAMGLRHRLVAQVVVEGGVSDGAHLVSIDTDSRSCSPEEAGRRAAAGAGVLSQAGAAWMYKKVDSVLRGPVAAELEAVMKKLQFARTLLVPANPGLGRTIRDGLYFVQGTPIDETDFRHDPEFPRLTSNVRNLLGKSCTLPIQLCSKDQPMPAAGLILGQTESAEDLRAWASRCDNSTLAAGGAEFFGALLVARGHTDSSPPTIPTASRSGEKQLFVCGSASASCEQFVSDMRRAGCPVFSLLPGEGTSSERSRLADEIISSLQLSPRVVLTIGAERSSPPADARTLLDELASLAASLTRRATVLQLYAEGGATAARLVRHLGWKRLDVIRELAPGVVTLAAAGSLNCLLTIKPGSYSWPGRLRA